MGSSWSSMWPPSPKLTEENLPNQTGKVFIITGASGGVGKELVSILYKHNAKIYVAARSKGKAIAAITDIEQQHPSSGGRLIFLPLDLGDLTTIRQSAEEFLRKESRLDVLWLNAGVMAPPQGSKSAQGYELQLGTNNIGHFLFTKLLHPALRNTAGLAPAYSVRVVWVSSNAIDIAPWPPIDFTNMDYSREESPWTKYGRSKAGNVLHASEFAKKTKEDGIVSVSAHPGMLTTDLQRHLPGWQRFLVQTFLTYPAKYGAYTELFAGLSDEVTVDHGDRLIAPWGRFIEVRKDLFDPALGRRYWDWTEEQIRPYFAK
ncbi:short-chain alcohol dehydrogenase [Conoideocrella luteorostrata]|uniref:Short-chain alcohol dehydrogenase n=1 Tax=Conoideocrella luteorostrata TaxID=1105319 RepID=A0AAJ0CJY4_9HYPO|nr:short-chain alcohol dehydrogenase [Conoideocrella luteorostrata]